MDTSSVLSLWDDSEMKDGHLTWHGDVMYMILSGGWGSTLISTANQMRYSWEAGSVTSSSSSGISSPSLSIVLGHKQQELLQWHKRFSLWHKSNVDHSQNGTIFTSKMVSVPACNPCCAYNHGGLSSLFDSETVSIKTQMPWYDPMISNCNSNNE